MSEWSTPKIYSHPLTTSLDLCMFIESPAFSLVLNTYFTPVALSALTFITQFQSSILLDHKQHLLLRFSVLSVFCSNPIFVGVRKIDFEAPHSRAILMPSSLALR